MLRGKGDALGTNRVSSRGASRSLTRFPSLALPERRELLDPLGSLSQLACYLGAALGVLLATVLDLASPALVLAVFTDRLADPAGRFMRVGWMDCLVLLARDLRQSSQCHLVLSELTDLVHEAPRSERSRPEVRRPPVALEPGVPEIARPDTFRDALVADRIGGGQGRVGHEQVAMHVMLVAPIAAAHEPFAALLDHVGCAVAALEAPVEVTRDRAPVEVTAPDAGYGPTALDLMEPGKMLDRESLLGLCKRGVLGRCGRIHALDIAISRTLWRLGGLFGTCTLDSTEML